MRRTLRFRPAWRVALACIVCALTALLVWPGGANSAPSRTVADLISPLAVGRSIARGYLLESIKRGTESDLLLMARHPGTRKVIELHVVNRGQWSNVPETRSFGIAYEAPGSSAPVSDCLAVTHALEAAVRANDPGDLGPVDAIALEPGTPPAPWVARAVARVSGPRRIPIGVGLVLVTWLLASLPRGRFWASAWLAALGLMLRVPELGLPFDRDQDVQRLFTGHLPIVEILTGAGLRDRHPPLYFLVLHVAEVFGQSETVARAPAAIAGALVGPAVLYGAWVARRRAGPGAALVALAVTISVELVRRSRECSDMPLFTLFAISVAAALVRASSEPSRRWRAALAVSYALALWTYYLAPLVLVGSLAAGWIVGLRSRPALRAVALGVLLGAPSLALEVSIFVRDSSARAAADVNPSLAWGRNGAAEMGTYLWHQTVDVLGTPLLVVVGLVALAALARRRAAVLVPLSGLLATFAGVALIAPFARVQPYYIDTVVPLAALAVASGLPVRRGSMVCTTVVALVVALGVAPRLQDAYDLYQPSREAVMPAMAETVARQPEQRVLVTADYDTTILAYYLSRRRGLPMDWAMMNSSESGIRLQGLEQELVPLVRVHSPGPDPDGSAVAKVDDETRGGTVLVLSREGLGLTRLDARLATCDLLLAGPRARLLRCRRPA